MASSNMLVLIELFAIIFIVVCVLQCECGLLNRLKTTEDSGGGGGGGTGLTQLPPQHMNLSKKCYTQTCRSEAFSIYRRLGGYFKPCDNFFLYTCGGFFMKENGLSDMENLQERISSIIYDELLSKNISENDTQAIRNAKILFESCKNREHDFYEEFKKIIINELDGWALLGNQYFLTEDDENTTVEISSTTNSTETTPIDSSTNSSTTLNDNSSIESTTNNQTEEMTEELSNIVDLVEKTQETNETETSKIITTIRVEPTSLPTLSKTTRIMSTHIKTKLYDRLIKFFRLGINPFFRIDVDVNPFNNTKFSVWIRRPVSIRFKSHQIIDSNLKYFLKRLVIHMNSSCSLGSVDEQVNGTIRLENAFNMLNKKNKYSPPIINMTIQDLIHEIPDVKNKLLYLISKMKTKVFFDWKLFIVDKVFNETFNMSVDMNQSIIIHDIDNLKNSIEMFKIESTQHRRDLDNFLVWELVKSMIQYFPNIEVNKTVTKTNGFENKTAAMCSRYVTVNLNFLMSKYFIEKQSDADTLKGAIQMTESIRTEFLSMISENSWMDDISKNKAIQKLNNMVFKIAYPDYILNETLMDDIYKNFIFNKSEFLKNDLLIKKITNLISFEYLSHEVHRQSWKFGPALANAAYFTLMNEIYIPVGIIQPPFYNKDTLMLFNYARLGSIIGHEIAHGFDSEGRKFDHYGNFHPDNSSLWNMSSIKEYKNKSECFVRHYSNYTIANLAQKLNGIQTLEENISDNLGFKAAYRAYKKWVSLNGEEKFLPDLYLSHDQLYFIAYAQTLCEFDTFKFVLEQNHSPNEIRLYGVVSNMKEFSSTFNCSSGDFHSPHEQCSIW